MDPDAAQAVFRGFAGRPADRLPLCAGLDVTDRVHALREALARVCDGSGSPVARFLQDAVPYYIEFYERTGVTGGAAMHDPLALAFAIDPALGTFETTRVEVETEGQWTRGMPSPTCEACATARGRWAGSRRRTPVSHSTSTSTASSPGSRAGCAHWSVHGMSASGGDTLAVLGAINVDLVVRGARLPTAGETVVGGEFSQHQGGKGGTRPSRLPERWACTEAWR